MDTKRIKTKFAKGLKAAFFIGFISFFIILSGRADTPCTPVSAHGEELNIKSLDAFTVPRKKQTILNLYLTANKAHDIWKKSCQWLEKFQVTLDISFKFKTDLSPMSFS